MILLFGIPILFAAAGLAQSPQNIVVTSAASFQPGIPARGSIGAIFLTGLKVSGPAQAQSAPLPWSLAGVMVTVGGAPAPLFSVSDLGGYQQINFQVPQEATTSTDGTFSVTVAQNGATGAAKASPIASADGSASPGEFFTISGATLGAFQHADYSPVTTANPAYAGETIIGYLTGLPGSTPTVPTGQASPTSPLAVVPQTHAPASPRVAEYFIYPENQAITFLGLTPGLVGVYQVNFVLAPNLAPGNTSLQFEYHWCNDACIFGGQGWSYSRPVILPTQ